jgi:hypothetical protein
MRSIFFTKHAIDRFRERFAGGLGYGHALAELKVLSQGARRLRDKTANGEERYEVGDGSRMVFVVKDDPRAGKVCVTVLFGEDEHGAESDPLESGA